MIKIIFKDFNMNDDQNRDLDQKMAQYHARILKVKETFVRKCLDRKRRIQQHPKEYEGGKIFKTMNKWTKFWSNKDNRFIRERVVDLNVQHRPTFGSLSGLAPVPGKYENIKKEEKQ